MAIFGGPHPDPHDDSPAEERKKARSGIFLSQRDRDDLSDRRAAAEEDLAERRWCA